SWVPISCAALCGGILSTKRITAMANSLVRFSNSDLVMPYLTHPPSAIRHPKSPLSAMPDRHDVSILDHIFFSFDPKHPLFFQGLHASMFYEIVVVANFGADEMVCKIGVNDTGCILRVCSAGDRPGTALFFADCKE